MKKVKYIALVLILALGLIGGAYAAWATNQNIVASVDTGHLDMEYTSLAIWADPKVCGSHQLGATKCDTCYLTGSKTGTGTNTATFTVGNLYPGVKPSLAMFCENKGTVPVKLADVKVTFDPAGSGVWNYLHAQVNARYKPAGEWDRLIGQKAGLARELAQLIKDAVGDQVLNPGDQIRFGQETEPGSIILWLDENTPNEFQGLEDITFTVEMTWQQWNL